MNLSRRSGVPFVPSQRNHPVGIETIEPDHMVMTPEAIASKFPAAFTPSETALEKPPLAT
jgi:hypothetical protein